jgi:hypothetical protein
MPILPRKVSLEKIPRTTFAAGFLTGKVTSRTWAGLLTGLFAAVSSATLLSNLPLSLVHLSSQPLCLPLWGMARYQRTCGQIQT